MRDHCNAARVRCQRGRSCRRWLAQCRECLRVGVARESGLAGALPLRLRAKRPRAMSATPRVYGSGKRSRSCMEVAVSALALPAVTSNGKRPRSQAESGESSPWLDDGATALDASLLTVGSDSVGAAGSALRSSPLTTTAREWASTHRAASSPALAPVPVPMHTPGGLAAFLRGVTATPRTLTSAATAGSTRKSKSRAAAASLGLVQSHLDFGQRNVGGCVVCPACGMVYTKGVGVDEERRHAAHCRAGELVAPKWSPSADDDADGAAPMALPSTVGSSFGPLMHVFRSAKPPRDGPWHRVHGFLCDVLGPRSSPWHEHTPRDEADGGAGGVCTPSAAGGATELSSILVAVVGPDRTVLAAASFGPIDVAWSTTTAPSSADADSAHPTAADGNALERPVWQDGDDVVRCSEPTSATLCVHQIWVAAAARRQGFATRLIDAGRAAALSDGSLLPAALVAFSQPTRSGMALARAWAARQGVPLLLVG